MDNRPPVPEPVKRILRQEAGFGCCRCGYPIYQYHHIIPYADDHHFRPEDMMLLCPNCHTSATSGALDMDEQRHFKAHPYNIARGSVNGPLAIKQRVMAVSLGSTQFVGDGTFIRVDNQPLLAVLVSPDGRLQLSVELYDRHDNLLGLIDKNEWIAGDPYPWDLEYGERWLLIRSRQGEISLYVDARPRVVSVRGHLWFKQQRFDINEGGIAFNGTALQPGHPGIHNAGVAELCLVGAGLVSTTEPPNLAIAPDPRFGQAALVSWPNVEERIQKGIEAWARLTGQPISALQAPSSRRPASQLPVPRKRRKK